MDLSSGEKIGAFIGYTFSDALSAAASGNLVSYNLSKYQELKEGDVIAVIDSSALDYAYRRQDIMTQAAYERYLSSGTEAARLEYEYTFSALPGVPFYHFKHGGCFSRSRFSVEYFYTQNFFPFLVIKHHFVLNKLIILKRVRADYRRCINNTSVTCGSRVFA